MSQYFAALFRRRLNDGWFRAGRYDVTTVDIITALAVVSMFLYAISPGGLFEPLIFFGPAVRSGEIWRLVTWPIAEQPGIFNVISIAFFWSFGQHLEALFGKVRFLAWVLTVAILPALVMTILGAFSTSLDFNVSFGLGPLFLAGIWVYAATYPNVRWFDIVPLWAVAAVFTVIQLLQFTGSRDSGAILFLLLGVGTALSAGRSLGLASAWPIPHVPVSIGSGRRRSSGGSGRGRSRQPKRPKGGGAPTGRRVVEGPWRSPASTMPPPPPPGPASAADQAELDDLLDKIGAQGMDALSNGEKQRLNELSKRLRNR